MNPTDCALKARIKEAFPDMPESSFHSWASDLYVLYTPELLDWLKANYDYWQNITIERANVKGSDWYGKNFFDIPFALLDEQIKSKQNDKHRD